MAESLNAFHDAVKDANEADARERAHVNIAHRQADALESIAKSLEALTSVVDTRTAMNHVRTLDYGRQSR